MLFRLPAKPSGAEPELPFRRNAPFPDAPPGRDEPFRAALVVRDVVRLGEAVRVADDVRRFWLVVRLPDVVRSVAVFRFGLAVARDDRPFVWAPDPDALVFRRVVDLEFLVVAIDSPILKAFDPPATAPLPRGRAFLTGRGPGVSPSPGWVRGRSDLVTKPAERSRYVRHTCA